jgi:hypothetical protein
MWHLSELGAIVTKWVHGLPVVDDVNNCLGTQMCREDITVRPEYGDPFWTGAPHSVNVYGFLFQICPN